MAMEIGGNDLTKRLSDIVDEMRNVRRAGDTQTYLSLDTAFHEAIIDASGNPYFIRAYGWISGKMAALRKRLGRDPHHMAKSMEEHDQIARLVHRRAFRQVEKILIGHIFRKEGSYSNLLLSESALASDLQTSTTPVREAIAAWVWFM